MSLNVLGVDPSLTKFGWCMARVDGDLPPCPVDAGLVKIDAQDVRDNGWDVSKARGRIMRVRTVIAALYALPAPDLIVFESFSPGPKISDRSPAVANTYQCIGGLGALAAVWDVPIMDVSPGAVKLAATSRRSASKGAMIAAIRTLIGPALCTILDEKGLRPATPGHATKTGGRDHPYDAYAAILAARKKPFFNVVANAHARNFRTR